MPSDLIELLNDVISTMRDAEEGYAKAAKGAHGDELRRVFDSCVQRRREFASRLRDEVKRLGGEPAAAGHRGGVLHRGWVDLEERLRPKEDPEFLADCQNGEAETVKHYERALAQENVSEDIRRILQAQLADVRRTVDMLSGLESVRRAG